ncbi:MAG: Lrp/AsnC ligand binding domain-containing protein [Methanomassiliicoccales archaeon]|nr:Lrp/AsnC ligand binding domain-containing protein [Methanomassiliicoccales archaeon]
MLINAEVGKEAEVLDAICAMPEAEKAYLVYGVYDIAVMVRSGTMEELEECISTKVRKVSGIKSTLTLIVSRECK